MNRTKMEISSNFQTNLSKFLESGLTLRPRLPNHHRNGFSHLVKQITLRARQIPNWHVSISFPIYPLTWSSPSMPICRCDARPFAVVVTLSLIRLKRWIFHFSSHMLAQAKWISLPSTYRRRQQQRWRHEHSFEQWLTIIEMWFVVVVSVTFSQHFHIKLLLFLLCFSETSRPLWGVRQVCVTQ